MSITPNQVLSSPILFVIVGLDTDQASKQECRETIHKKLRTKTSFFESSTETIIIKVQNVIIIV